MDLIGTHRPRRGNPDSIRELVTGETDVKKKFILMIYLIQDLPYGRRGDLTEELAPREFFTESLAPLLYLLRKVSPRIGPVQWWVAVPLPCKHIVLQTEFVRRGE